MQVAVVSVLLMAGACGDSSEPLPAPPPITSAVPATSQSPRATLFLSNDEQIGAVPACIPSATFHGATGGAYSHTWFAGHINYSPVCFLHHCAVYYPGNYAEPYDYREIYNYPWHGPRPIIQAGSPSPELASRRRATDARSSFR